MQLFAFPGMASGLYVHYDCNIKRTDILAKLSQGLCSASSSVRPAIAQLALQAQLALLQDCTFVEPIERFSEEEAAVGEYSNDTEECACKEGRKRHASSALALTAKATKVKVEKAAALFNAKPRLGLAALQEYQLLSDPLDEEEVAVFLRETSQLDKAMVGDYVRPAAAPAQCIRALHHLARALCAISSTPADTPP